MRPLGLHGLVLLRGASEYIPLELVQGSFSLTLPGTGGSRVQRHVLKTSISKEIFGNGMDAAAF